jgi:hypothetical protein
VSVGGCLVVGNGESGVFRRARVAGHGGRRPDLGKRIGFSTVELKMNVNRPIRDQRSRLELTPSRCRFLKEPLDFFIIEPAVLSVLSEIRFCVLKAYFLPDKSKIRFQVFTVLPLELFWS